MKKVLLCCAMGASSSIFEAKIKDYITKSNIELDIVAKSVNDVKSLMKKNDYGKYLNDIVGKKNENFQSKTKRLVLK